MNRTKDHLPFVEPRRAVQTAYAALSAIQGESSGVQVRAVAVLFKTLVEELKLDVSELLNSTERTIKADDTFFQREVRALRAYITGELK